MKITLEPHEAEKFFYDSLCNVGGSLSNSGIELEYDEQDYAKAKAALKEAGKECCFEDVLMEILRDGNKLTFVDEEGEGEYTRTITMKEVHERVEKAPFRHLLDCVNEDTDATTADIIIQSVLYDGEIIFG